MASQLSYLAVVVNAQGIDFVATNYDDNNTIPASNAQLSYHHNIDFIYKMAIKALTTVETLLQTAKNNPLYFQTHPFHMNCLKQQRHLVNKGKWHHHVNEWTRFLNKGGQHPKLSYFIEPDAEEEDVSDAKGPFFLTFRLSMHPFFGEKMTVTCNGAFPTAAQLLNAEDLQLIAGRLLQVAGYARSLAEIRVVDHLSDKALFKLEEEHIQHLREWSDCIEPASEWTIVRRMKSRSRGSAFNAYVQGMMKLRGCTEFEAIQMSPIAHLCMEDYIDYKNNPLPEAE